MELGRDPGMVGRDPSRVGRDPSKVVDTVVGWIEILVRW